MADFIFSKTELSRNKTFLKMGEMGEILQIKIHLKTTQKLPNDHIADEVSNN